MSKGKEQRKTKKAARDMKEGVLNCGTKTSPIAMNPKTGKK